MNSKSIVRKAVIPIAGLGTRHFPASHAVKKELFPVVGADGIARALFHYHLLELEAAGIQEICIITQPGEDEVVKRYLRGPDDNYLKRLEKYPALLREAEQMRGFARRVSFAVQHQQEGYGHAVYQSKAFANGEMVLLGLGDHLFRGKPVSPYRELADMAQVSDGKSVSAVNRISAGELKGYGTIAGQRRAENSSVGSISKPVGRASPRADAGQTVLAAREDARPTALSHDQDFRLIDVSLIIEKPAVAVAQEKLRVNGLPAATWLGWFGMHLLAPSIYDILGEMIRDNVRDNGEFQLTRAQEIQRQRHGYLALEMTGAQRFDFGVPDDFVASVQAFRHSP